MTIDEYRIRVKETRFEELPFIMDGKEPQLKSFVDFNKADIDLKIYLAQLILCRCFSPTGGIVFPHDSYWFISESFKSYDNDLIRSWTTPTIRKAAEYIMTGDHFTDRVMGTTYMFGIVEFYAKYQLGWRPNNFDFFDKQNQNPFRKMSIGDSIARLRKTRCDLAKTLNAIDTCNINRLKEAGIKEGRFTIAQMADRISLARNAMLHGETHGFSEMGQYLIILYFIFHLHDLKLLNKTTSVCQ